MSASNKLIFSLNQALTTDQKIQACKNIGAVQSYLMNTLTGSLQLSQAQASSGTVAFSVFWSGISGVIHYNVGITVPETANLGQNSYPVIVELNFTFEGGATAHTVVATGVLCRTGSNRRWDLCVDFTYDFDHHNQPITALNLSIDWGDGVIPQNTEIIYTIRSTGYKTPT